MRRGGVGLAVVLLAMLLSPPTRADVVPFGGCSGRSRRPAPAACKATALAAALGKTCEECAAGAAACLERLKKAGYTHVCDRGADAGGTVQVWCKDTASSARQRALPLAGAVLFAGLCLGARYRRRRP